MAIASDTSWQDSSPARPVLGAVGTALDALTDSTPERLWALSDGEVTQAFALLGQLRASGDAHLVAVLAEAKRRGLGTGDGWGPVDWARAQAPQLPTRTLNDLDTVATAAADASAGDIRLGDVIEALADSAHPDAANAQTHSDEQSEDDTTGDKVAGAGDADEAFVREDGAGDVGSGGLELGKAAQIVRFHRSVRGLAEPGHLAELTTITLRAARGPRALSERGLATALRHAADQLRPDRLVEHDADLRRAHRSLVKGPGPLGLSRYTLLLDEEGAAVLDTAVDALAKPSPDAETGAPDPRPAAARRADALLDLVTEPPPRPRAGPGRPRPSSSSPPT